MWNELTILGKILLALVMVVTVLIAVTGCENTPPSPTAFTKSGGRVYSHRRYSYRDMERHYESL